MYIFVSLFHHFTTSTTTVSLEYKVYKASGLGLISGRRNTNLKHRHSWLPQNQSPRSGSGTQTLPKALFSNWLHLHQVLLALCLVRPLRNEFQQDIPCCEQCCLSVSYPSLQPPTNTAFRCYAPTKAKTDSVDHGKKATDERVDDQDLLLVGESDKVEFISTKEESQRAADAGCR